MSKKNSKRNYGPSGRIQKGPPAPASGFGVSAVAAAPDTAVPEVKEVANTAGINLTNTAVPESQAPAPVRVVEPPSTVPITVRVIEPQSQAPAPVRVVEPPSPAKIEPASLKASSTPAETSSTSVEASVAKPLEELKEPISHVKTDEKNIEEPIRSVEKVEEVVEAAPVIKVVADETKPVQLDPPVEADVEVEPIQLSLEDQLRREVRQEFESREIRLVELNKLQSELSQSMARKQEVEKVITGEVEALWPRLQDEFYKETARIDQLLGSLGKFKKALKEKLEIQDLEKKTLVQMKDVRGKVSEETILVQLNEAISKKGDLIDIESGICDDIAECCRSLEVEINDTRTKLASLNNAIASLPSLTDEIAMRAYTWSDVEVLQKTLFDSLESSQIRDEKVNGFLVKFESAMRKRGLILGVNTDLPSSITTVTGVKSTIASLKEVASAENLKKIKDIGVPISQMTKLMKTKSNEDLSAAAIDGAKKSLSSLGEVSFGVLSATGSFIRSDDGYKSGQVLGESVEALKDAGTSLGAAFNSAQKIWVDNFDNNADTTDQYVSRLQNTVKTVFKDKDVRASLTDISSSAATCGKQASKAALVATSKIAEELSAGEKFAASLLKLQEGLTELFSIASVATSRIAGELQNQSRQLPSGKE